MAGVVNILLSRQADGVEVNVNYGAHRTDLSVIDKDITDGQTVNLSGRAGWTLNNDGFISAGLDAQKRRN